MVADPVFVDFLKSNDYFQVRQLPDGSYAALYKLMFTTAICSGLDAYGWKYRWCFEDPSIAEQELLKMNLVDDVPTGYIAHRWSNLPPARL